MEITQQQKIDIIARSKAIIKKGTYVFLCHIIPIAIADVTGNEEWLHDIRDIVEVFPLFTHDNAIKHFNAYQCCIWWKDDDLESRFRFLDYILTGEIRNKGCSPPKESNDQH